MWSENDSDEEDAADHDATNKLVSREECITALGIESARRGEEHRYLLHRL